jgi:superfamily II DNA or RNA helicase
MPATAVRLIKRYNFLIVDTHDLVVKEIVKRALTYDKLIPHRGLSAAKRERQGLSTIEVQPRAQFAIDRYDRIVTAFGYWRTLLAALRSASIAVEVVDTDESKPNYQPDWANLDSFDFSFRSTQQELLETVIRRKCGRIDCATGYGKSFVITALCALYPNATFDIVCKSVAVVRERLHPALVQMFGNVGLVGGGVNKPGARITCYTADSMHKSPATSDFLIGDEIHLLATDRLISRLVRWQNSRNFGLTASMDMRFDKADFELIGVFGPLIFRSTYAESVSTEAVVPIRVKWRKVQMDYNPVAGVTDQTRRMKAGIWRNASRNRLIVADARSYNQNTQVLITCATLEHALVLKQQLPEFTVVYREPTDRQRKSKLRAEGLLTGDEPEMSLDYRSHLARKFETGELKKVICTTVWNIGVSFDNLSVLIRADGTASAINDVQIPGRTSRKADGKEYSIVHDYDDRFDHGFSQRSGRRRSNYKRQGWEQEDIK